MEFRQSSKFTKELKRLKKKYKSLDQDLQKLKKVLVKFPTGLKSRNWAVLRKIKQVTIIKTRLSCAYLKKKSLRVVYAYHENTMEIELIEFLELYGKNEKDREDKRVIEEYLKKVINQ